MAETQTTKTIIICVSIPETLSSQTSNVIKGQKLKKETVLITMEKYKVVQAFMKVPFCFIKEYSSDLALHCGGHTFLERMVTIKVTRGQDILTFSL